MRKIKKFFSKFIGTKKFYKELLFVAMPIALQQLVSAVVNLLDGLMVSNYGEKMEKIGQGIAQDAQGGVAIASKYYSCFNMIMFMFAISCSVFVAQFFGAKMKDKIKRTFGIALIVCLSFSILAAAGGLIFREDILFLFTGGAESNPFEYNYGLQYLSIVVISFIPQAITNAFTACFRSIKKTTVPLISSICAAVANFSLNYVLINGMLGVPELGVKGAAIATCVSRGVELLILLIYFFYTKPDFYGSFREIFHIDSELLKGVIVKSLPIVGAQILTEAMGVFLFFVYAKLDVGNSANLVAVNVTQQVNDLVVVFIGGLGSAASVLVGSRLGQNKIEEAKQNARWQLAYAIFFSLIAMTIMILIRGLICKWYKFDGEDASLLKLLMIFQACSFPFLVYANNVIFITRAGGYTKAPLFIKNLVYLGVKLPLIILFVWICPEVYTNHIASFLDTIGIVSSFIIFIFLIDRLAEVLCAIIATIIYNVVPWSKNITYIGKSGDLSGENS